MPKRMISTSVKVMSSSMVKLAMVQIGTTNMEIHQSQQIKVIEIMTLMGK